MQGADDPRHLVHDLLNLDRDKQLKCNAESDADEQGGIVCLRNDPRHLCGRTASHPRRGRAASLGEDGNSCYQDPPKMLSEQDAVNQMKCRQGMSRLQMKCFYWRRFRTTVSWHCLRHESFGEGEQALTHGAIDAEEHAHFHVSGSFVSFVSVCGLHISDMVFSFSDQNIQSAPGSWYTIAHLAEVNQRANTAKHQERPQLTKFTGAWDCI